MNWHLATDTELLTVIFHEPNVPLSWIFAAAEEYGRRHPGNPLKWYRYEKRCGCQCATSRRWRWRKWSDKG